MTRLKGFCFSEVSLSRLYDPSVLQRSFRKEKGVKIKINRSLLGLNRTQHTSLFIFIRMSDSGCGFTVVLLCDLKVHQHGRDTEKKKKESTVYSETKNK